LDQSGKQGRTREKLLNYDRFISRVRAFPHGAKAVEGKGGTLDELFADLDARHAGLRDRLVDDKGLRKFVNVYLNDEDVRFLGGLETEVADGDSVTILPAVAGG